MSTHINRRQFIGAAAASAGAALSLKKAAAASSTAKPAVLGGKPAHTGGWPKWPEWRESWEGDVLKVLRSGRWCRAGGGGQVPEFEAAWAKLLGAKRALGTASGTTALITSLYVMGVDAGDEVICSPYTFSATYNSILIQKALPVFADTDPETLTMCPKSIESRITERTKAILPVHIYGMPCYMDEINAIARKHKLAVVEDACQAWLAEYKGRKCGTLGDLGAFSFQNSKHIPSGEGGAITGMNEKLVDKCHSYHNCGRSFGTNTGSGSF
ncbi:MAG: DegT/DnrJ/EryC1/StrS family aminotransferase, partial [Verrucomicrobia bacterium]|nr:DegT/DnrJ/EryC1/StrS family aminotransferase [Verrucomicrobiota bacterium]